MSERILKGSVSLKEFRLSNRPSNPRNRKTERPERDFWIDPWRDTWLRQVSENAEVDRYIGGKPLVQTEQSSIKGEFEGSPLQSRHGPMNAIKSSPLRAKKSGQTGTEEEPTDGRPCV
ncbi:hypothetical protein RUM44_013672 [Polyplax serrata]|uniref:Uncharacterized protein n=1 Tax=Polyplax serrata TaxID=468196 RepID=A0ABR1BIX7_POLSC